MQRVPGSASADALLRIGLCRTDIIGALIREVGLDDTQAACAWDSAVAKSDANFPYRLMIAIDAPV